MVQIISTKPTSDFRIINLYILAKGKIEYSADEGVQATKTKGCTLIFVTNVPSTNDIIKFRLTGKVGLTHPRPGASLLKRI